MPAKEAAHESDSKLRAAYRTLVPMAIREQLFYIRRGVGRRTLKSELQFEYHLTEHCDLNCAGCGHLSPLAEPEFADFEEASRDFAQLSKLFGGRMRWIHLLGGEPLLHPELLKFLKMARDNFPVGTIQLVTNGVKLLDQPEEFWTVCRENRITVAPTKYPIQLDFDGIAARAHFHQVDFQYFKEVSTFFKFAYDLEGRQNIDRSFSRCISCYGLYHGKISPCIMPQAIQHFNRYFGTHIEVGSKDSIDIYEAKSGKEIMKFLARPIPLCRYCLGKVEEVPWHHSQKDIKEWTV